MHGGAEDCVCCCVNMKEEVASGFFFGGGVQVNARETFLHRGGEI